MPIVSATNSLTKIVFAVNNKKETDVIVFKIIPNTCNTINHANKVPNLSFVSDPLVLFSLDLSGANLLVFVTFLAIFYFWDRCKPILNKIKII